MSFASEPGRDDGNLPPVNIVVPDDARELGRDVLAYHREMRARRRRQRLARIFSPFNRQEFGGHAAILPLIATIVALAMLAGAMLSVITISPASAPTVPAAAAPAFPSSKPVPLPSGTVRLGAIDGRVVPVRSLVNSLIALVPANCRCGTALRSLAARAVEKHVGLYFVASGAAMSQLENVTARYGGRAAKAVYDPRDVIGAATHAVGLTVLVVASNATAEINRNLPPDFQISQDPRPVPSSG